MNAAKWDASNRASNRAHRILSAAGEHVKSYGIDGSGKASVECNDAAQAARVARLTGGKVAASGHGHAANTVVVKP